MHFKTISVYFVLFFDVLNKLMLKKSLIFTLILLIQFMNQVHARDYSYNLTWLRPNDHTFVVELLTQKQAGDFTIFQIPAWRPGRYMLQNYSASISHFVAEDESGKKLSWDKIDKDSWKVKNPASAKLKITYRYYANQIDAGSTFMGATQAYINPSNLFMHVKDDLDSPCTLEMPKMPNDWKSATALKVISKNKFSAESYHDFVDAPSIFSPTLKQFQFKVLDADIYVHFQGKYNATPEDEKKLIETLSKTIKEQAAIFGGLPLKYYHFIFQILPFNIRHAVEHKYCSMYAMPETSTKSGGGFSEVYSICSHEFWHLWNVKRIRPAAMWPYDYQKEAYTSLPWFTEGFTSFYQDLALTRSGIYTPAEFFDLQAANITDMESMYATEVVSCGMCSYDTWLVTSPFAHPNHNVSFYDLGQRVGLLLDFQIRIDTKGAKSLDDVYRHLFKNCYEKNQGVPEDGVLKACETVTGKSYADFFAKYINGTEKLPYKEIFGQMGLKFESKDMTDLGSRMIGIESFDRSSGKAVIRAISPKSDGAEAGLGNKDVILSIDNQDVNGQNVESFFYNLKNGQTLKMKVMSEYETKEITVKFTDKYIPKEYSLKIDKENDLLKGFLKSQVK